MIKALTKVLCIGLLLVTFGFGKGLKPYILGAESNQPMDSVKVLLHTHLVSNGFTILGEYQPAEDATRWVIVVNSSELTDAVQSVGGLTAFASTLRIALTKEEENIRISYVNPQYMGNAYFRKRYPDVEIQFTLVDKKLKKVMEMMDTPLNQPFGVEDAFSPSDLRKYHYMFGMEYFEDVVTLNEFNSFSEGKRLIEDRLAISTRAVEVYSYEVPGKNLKVYGIALKGNRGEKHFLPIIDIGSPKHTAFLPYEILLNDKQAVMMHGRYRIALSFPDLTMGTFGKIMSTPGDIEDLMRSITH